MTTEVTGLDQLCINTIRTLAIDAVQKAKSGHAGAPMGAAPMAYALWSRFLKHNPANPAWADRDRFVLSAGHASLLLYSLLALTGYDLKLEELEQFRAQQHLAKLLAVARALPEIKAGTSMSVADFRAEVRGLLDEMQPAKTAA